MSAIHVRDLGKAYPQFSSRWARLADWLQLPGSRRQPPRWVLQGVSFAVGRGEVVGILGVNGAGKSTLLKIVAGTTQPTTGSVRVEGSVAALLELGMGFHPDFTGRQNALLSGQLMGHPESAVIERIPEIERFAEIGPYFDMPLRTYSSGMTVRLAFSVATAIRPDVLIVDEALAVGDGYFQVKSFSRINEFKRLGTTILFVSHDTGAVKSLCNRALLLKDGRIEREGSAAAVADYYSAVLTSRLLAEHVVQDNSGALVTTRSGNRDVEVLSVQVLGADGGPRAAFLCGEPGRIEVCVRVRRPIAKLVQGFLIRDRRGNDVYGTNTFHLDRVIHAPAVDDRFRIAFDFPMNLGEEVYSVSVASVDSDTVLWQSFDWIENVATFRVIRAEQPHFIGIASLDATCAIDAIGAKARPVPDGEPA